MYRRLTPRGATALRRMSAAIAAMVLSLGTTFGQPARAEPPVVVELFTSQGCNTCPPADKFLGELAERPGVIALSLHVDYWDYLGWKDTFGSPAFSHRQRGYAASLGARRTYTPQIVIQGQVGLVGSHRIAVDMAIKGAAAEAEAGAFATVSLSQTKDRLDIDIAPTEIMDRVRLRGPLMIVAIGYDHPHEQQIDAGENTGERIVYHNVARDYRIIGDWGGGADALTIEVDPKLKGYVVMIQLPGPGRIVAAERLEF